MPQLAPRLRDVTPMMLGLELAALGPLGLAKRLGERLTYVVASMPCNYCNYVVASMPCNWVVYS